MDAKTVLKYAEDQEAKFVSVRFSDPLGSWQHLTFPIHELDDGSFEDGFGFDGSSIRGWAPIHESDIPLNPVGTRFCMESFVAEPTVILVANAVDPITKEGYAFDPRSVAQRAESYLKFTGIADTVNFGPEAEFFVFDGVEVDNEPHAAGYRIHSEEGIWSSGRREDTMRGPNLGYRLRNKEGYVPVPPADSLADLRSEIALTLEQDGITVECHHHEVATAGQCEIDFRYSTQIGRAHV